MECPECSTEMSWMTSPDAYVDVWHCYKCGHNEQTNSSPED